MSLLWHWRQCLDPRGRCHSLQQADNGSYCQNFHADSWWSRAKTSRIAWVTCNKSRRLRSRLLTSCSNCLRKPKNSGSPEFANLPVVWWIIQVRNHSEWKWMKVSPEWELLACGLHNVNPVPLNVINLMALPMLPSNSWVAYPLEDFVMKWILHLMKPKVMNNIHWIWAGDL